MSQPPNQSPFVSFVGILIVVGTIIGLIPVFDMLVRAFDEATK